MDHSGNNCDPDTDLEEAEYKGDFRSTLYCCDRAEGTGGYPPL